MAASDRKRNYVWNGLGGSVAVLSNVILFPIAMMAMTPGVYGVWLLCFVSTTLLVQADLGLGSAIVRQLSSLRLGTSTSVYESANRVSFSIFIFLALLLPLVQYAFLSLFFELTDAGGEAKSFIEMFIIVNAVALCLGVLGRYFVSLLQSHGRFEYERQAAVVGFVVRALFVVGAWTTSGSIWFVVAGEVIGAVLPGIACAVIAARQRRMSKGMARRRDFAAAGRLIFRFSLPVFASSFATMMALQLPVYFVGGVLGSSQTVVFVAATKIYQTGRMTLGWITGPALQEATGLFVANRVKEYRLLYDKVVLLGVTLSMMLVAPLVISSEWVISVWLGSSYETYASAFSIIVLAQLLLSIYGPGVVFSAAAGRPGIVAGLNVAWCVFTLALAYPLTVLFGLQGSVSAVVLPILILFPFYLNLTNRAAGVSLRRTLVSVIVICTGPIVGGLIGFSFTTLVADNVLVSLIIVTVASSVTCVGLCRLLWGRVMKEA